MGLVLDREPIFDRNGAKRTIDGAERENESTRFFVSKNHVYKNVEAQICLKFKNIVVILLVAISISFPASDEI